MIPFSQGLKHVRWLTYSISSKLKRWQYSNQNMEQKYKVKCRLVKEIFAGNVASEGCRCTLIPHGGTSRRDFNSRGYSISRCCDVMYFATGQPGISTEDGQHVLEKALFLESFLISCSLFVCLHVKVPKLVNEVILKLHVNELIKWNACTLFPPL